MEWNEAKEKIRKVANECGCTALVEEFDNGRRIVIREKGKERKNDSSK